MSKNANELIELGEQASKKNAVTNSHGQTHYSGVEYEKWAADVVFFLSDNVDLIPTTLYDKVNNAALKANGNGEKYYNIIIGFLKSFSERY